ncbi:MAG: hypothetical protein LBR73_09305 [Oscillospiraceae bacterium]|jgi:hypothetical protein|nr:hypothetical protein [Oscillospiraceae bacterium]
MSKLRPYQLLPEEAFMRKASNVSNGRNGLYTDEILLTTRSFVWTRMRMFGGIKEIRVYPLYNIKEYNRQPQVMQILHPLNNQPALAFYFTDGTEEYFTFQLSKHKARKEIAAWIADVCSVRGIAAAGPATAANPAPIPQQVGTMAGDIRAEILGAAEQIRDRGIQLGEEIRDSILSALRLKPLAPIPSAHESPPPPKPVFPTRRQPEPVVYITEENKPQILEGYIPFLQRQAGKPPFALRMQRAVNQIEAYLFKRGACERILGQLFTPGDLSYNYFYSRISAVETVMQSNSFYIANRVAPFDTEEYREVMQKAATNTTAQKRLAVLDGFFTDTDSKLEENEEILLKVDLLLAELSKLTTTNADARACEAVIDDLDGLIQNTPLYRHG